MVKRRLIWATLAIFTFLTFLFLIPIKVYNLSPLLFSAFGTALVIFFIVQGVYDFQNIKEYRDKVKNGNDKKFKVIIISCIPFAFILYLVFFVNFGFSKSNEIDNYGLKTKGIVISTHYKNLRRKTGNSKVFYAKIKFVTKKGTTIISENQIQEQLYNNIVIGQEVELNYSERNPKIFKITIANTVYN